MHVTRYRDATVLRQSSNLSELEDTTLLDSTKLLAIVETAEEYVLALGEPATITTASQKAFDAACFSVITRLLANPAETSISKVGEYREEWGESAAVKNWINKWASSGNNPGGLQYNNFERR